MIKRIERLTLELSKRKLFFLKEIKRTMLKSLIQTQNIKLKKKLVFSKQNRQISRKCTISRHAGLCLFTGRSRGVVRFLNYSRQTLKRQALENKTQNIKIGSW